MSRPAPRVGEVERKTKETACFLQRQFSQQPFQHLIAVVSTNADCNMILTLFHASGFSIILA